MEVLVETATMGKFSVEGKEGFSRAGFYCMTLLYKFHSYARDNNIGLILPCQEGTTTSRAPKRPLQENEADLAEGERRLSDCSPAAPQADLEDRTHDAGRVLGHIVHVRIQRKALHPHPQNI